MKSYYGYIVRINFKHGQQENLLDFYYDDVTNEVHPYLIHCFNIKKLETVFKEEIYYDNEVVAPLTLRERVSSASVKEFPTRL